MTHDLIYENNNKKIENKSVYNNYRARGFRDAGTMNGNETAFDLSIENFYTDLVLDHRNKTYNVMLREIEINEVKNSINEKISIHKSEIKKIQEEYIPQTEQELKKAEKELFDFKKDPSKFIRYEKDNLKLWIFGIMSLFVAIFLYFFYSSVIYSAVFREFTINKYTIFNSIFYPKAIEESYNRGIASFMITMLSPFIFLTLGILLENLKNKSMHLRINYWYIITIVFVFSLDALLAFHISERVYNSKAINTYGNNTIYNLKDALLDPNFWIIIVLGFVVYMIFGKIFYLFNEERKGKNLIDNFENSLLQRIDLLKGKIYNYKNKIESLEAEISSLNYKTAEIININAKVYFNKYELNKILNEYTLGWIQYLTNAQYDENYINKMQQKLKNFLIKLGINEYEE